MDLSDGAETEIGVFLLPPLCHVCIDVRETLLKQKAYHGRAPDHPL